MGKLWLLDTLKEMLPGLYYRVETGERERLKGVACTRSPVQVRLRHEVTISKCHPEPFGVAQDKLREGNKALENMVLTPLAVV